MYYAYILTYDPDFDYFIYYDSLSNVCAMESVWDDASESPIGFYIYDYPGYEGYGYCPSDWTYATTGTDDTGDYMTGSDGTYMYVYTVDEFDTAYAEYESSTSYTDYYYYDYYDYYSYDSYGYYDYYYGAYYDSWYGDYYEGGDWDDDDWSMGGDMGNFTSEARGAVMDYFWYALDTNEEGGNSTDTCDTNMDCDGNGQTMCCVNIVSTSEDGMTDQMFRCMNRGVAEMSWEQTLTTDSGDDMYVNLKCMADGAAFLKAGLASVFVLIASTY